MFMYDAAYSPSLSVLKSHGAAGASHYMTGPYAGTSPQPGATLAMGMFCWLNWERLPTALIHATRTVGQGIARDALAAVPSWVRRDNTAGIVFSVDADVLGSDLHACDAGFDGLNDVLRPNGIQVKTYAEGGIIRQLHDSGRVQGGQWLSMSEGFGGFDVHDPRVAVVQMHNAAGDWIGTDIPGTDRNTVLNASAMGALWPAGNSPSVPSQPKENQMEVVYATVQKLPLLVTGTAIFVCLNNADASSLVQQGVPKRTVSEQLYNTMRNHAFIA